MDTNQDKIFDQDQASAIEEHMLREATLMREIPEIDVESHWRAFKNSAINKKISESQHNLKITKRLRLATWISTAVACVAMIVLIQNKFHVFNESPQPSYNNLLASGKDENYISLLISGNTYRVGDDISGEQIDSIIKVHNLSDNEISIKTPRKKNTHISLWDGSEIWLNAESEASFRRMEQQKHRIVSLKGEAFFSVTKGKGDFIVETPYLTTKVFGTKFNIKCYSKDDAHVTLVEGSVEVTSAKMSNSVLLKPGEDVHVISGTEDMITNVADTKSISSWKDGYFYFDDATLEEIVMTIGRWYDIPVSINSKGASKEQLHFMVPREKGAEKVVSLLDTMSSGTVTIKNGLIVVE